MKNYILALLFASLMLSCGSKKGYMDKNNADKSLQDAVKKLNKNPDDEKALEAVPELYTLIQKKHLDQIAASRMSSQDSKWDNIVSEYEMLQNAYNAIMNSPAAFKKVTPESYASNIVEARDSGAGAYYRIAESYFVRKGRESAKFAYNNYKKAGKFVSGYKDINEKMQKSYENAIVNVIIMPVQDNSIFSSGWGSFGNNYSNEYFQQKLLSDLNNNNIFPARYYNQWDARRLNVSPDWNVDFRLKSIIVPNTPQTTYTTREASKQIQIGTDTAGKPVYKTVTATLNINKTSFVSRMNMETSVMDIITRKVLSFRNFNEEFKTEQESATFSGDQRALSQSDWDLINKTGFNNAPRKEEVLVELYKKIYPQVLTQIRQAASW